tara:strand:+ start:3431 stop:3721 length:291 start_codon:yes stop_codon:yes gene_type:complete
MAATEQNQFSRLGHPGRAYHVLKYTGGQVDFTGSLYGYGAIKVVLPGTATASLSGGGQIPLDHIDANSTIYPLSISQISGSLNQSIAYVFKTQGTV